MSTHQTNKTQSALARSYYSVKNLTNTLLHSQWVVKTTDCQTYRVQITLRLYENCRKQMSKLTGYCLLWTVIHAYCRRQAAKRNDWNSTQTVSVVIFLIAGSLFFFDRAMLLTKTSWEKKQFYAGSGGFLALQQWFSQGFWNDGTATVRWCILPSFIFI